MRRTIVASKVLLRIEVRATDYASVPCVCADILPGSVTIPARPWRAHVNRFRALPIGRTFQRHRTRGSHMAFTRIRSAATFSLILSVVSAPSIGAQNAGTDSYAARCGVGGVAADLGGGYIPLPRGDASAR